MSDSKCTQIRAAETARSGRINQKFLKASLHAGACMFALAVGMNSVALAQDDAAVPPPPQPKTAAAAPTTEITITGSRIERSGMTTPTPVTAVSAADLKKMDPGNMIMSLNQLPQFYNDSSPDQPGFFSTSPGAGNLDLRGLGPNRTLVLLDGRRVVPSSRQGSTDINVFPEALVKSAEIVTGGASAAYGTDAVSGVVNFILDKDFTGIEAHVQGGITARADHENYDTSLTFGHDIGSRGHILLSGERYWADQATGYKGRDWYKAYGQVTNPAYNAVTNPNVPQRIIAPDVVSTTYTDGGLILQPGSALNGMMFLPGGAYTKFIQSDLSSGLGGTGSQSIQDGGSGYNPQTDPYVAQLATRNHRGSGFAYADWDFSDNLTVYAQGVYGENKVNQSNTPAIMFPPIWQGTIYQDNAFLPDSIRQTMINEGLNSFTFSRYSSDIETARAITSNQMLQGTLGFDATTNTGGFFDGWKVKGYGQFGTNSRTIRQSNWIRPQLLFAALDAVRDPATGQIVCRAALAGNPAFQDCVPVDLFGAGSASQQAIAYITGQTQPKQTITTPLYATNSFSGDGYAGGYTATFDYGPDKVIHSRTKEWDFDLSASGEVWHGFGAGAVFGAVGVAYRKDSVAQIVEDPTNPASDPNAVVVHNDPANGLQGVPFGYTTGRPTGFAFSNFPNVFGSLNVKEAFTEVQVPLLADMAFAKSLDFSGAIRWADYSGSGTSWSWKYGLDWAVVDSVRLRGTMSRDVRAATLEERFDRTANAVSVNDPEFGGQSIPVGTTTGGNPNVQPEKADTITVGAVLTPTFLDGFAMSFDYYDIKIKGAIGQLGAQRVVDDCFKGAADLCAQITRDPTTNQLLQINDIYQNINEARVRGLDLELTYNTPLKLLGGGAESLNTRLFGTYLIENSSTNIGAAKVDNAGVTGGLDYPHIKGNLNVIYNNGPFQLFVEERYIGHGKLNGTWTQGVQIDNNRVKSAFYTDMNVTYTFGQDSDTTWDVFFNVTNLFDKAPPVAAGWSPFGGATQANASLFDVLGRRFVLGFRLRT